MYEADSQLAYTDSTNEYRENRTAVGAVTSLLAVPALVAVLAAPAVAAGVVLAVVGLTLGERVARRARGTGEEAPPSPDRASHPA